MVQIRGLELPLRHIRVACNYVKIVLMRRYGLTYIHFVAVTR